MARGPPKLKSKSKILLDPFKLTAKLMLGGLDLFFVVEKVVLLVHPIHHVGDKKLYNIIADL